MKIEMTWAGGDWEIGFRAETEAEKKMLVILGKIQNPKARVVVLNSRGATYDDDTRDALALTLSEGGVER